MTLKFLTTRETVRQYCIYMRLYTRGDNESYSRMLDACDARLLSLADICVICTDIKAHSDPDTVSMLYDGEKGEHIEFMESFINDCCRVSIGE